MDSCMDGDLRECRPAYASLNECELTGTQTTDGHIQHE